MIVSKKKKMIGNDSTLLKKGKGKKKKRFFLNIKNTNKKTLNRDLILGVIANY